VTLVGQSHLGKILQTLKMVLYSSREIVSVKIKKKNWRMSLVSLLSSNGWNIPLTTGIKQQAEQRIGRNPGLL
jgi:hypothetical protein